MNLNSLFEPSSIAVVGASTNQQKIGYQIVKKLKKSSVKLYPINPQYQKILKRKCYPSILNIKKPIDQVIIVIPAKFVLQIIKQAVLKKVKSVVVVSAGFSESGEAGKKLENLIKKTIKKTNLKLIGPNCLGYANPKKLLDITFAKTPPPEGNIALISQSGAIGSFLFNWAAQENLGFSKFISLGNRAGLNENHCLDYLKNDSQVKVIGLYLESFASGKQFLTTASKVSRKKPVIVLFGGLETLGKKAAQSHTAALSPEKRIIKTALKQANCIQAKSLEEFTNLLEVFSLEPPLKDNDLTILTNAGGPAILAADKLSQTRLDLRNLTDMLGDATAEKLKKTLINHLKIKSTDAYLIILSPQIQTDFNNMAKNIVKQFKNRNKPVIISLLGGEITQSAEKILHRAKISTIKFPQQAVQYFNTLFIYYHRQKTLSAYPARQSPRPKINKPDSIKNNTWKQISRLAKAYHLPLVKTIIINSKNLSSTIKQLGFPLVLKSDPSEASHRTEKKGLYLNLKSLSAIKKALNNLEKNFNTILAQPQLKSGQEIFIGFQSSKDFPPMLTIGSGGIYTEVYQDIAHTFLPINKKIALQLIKATKIGQIITGVRNLQPLAVDKLINLIINTSFLVSDFPQIKSIDINPVILTKTNAQIVDIKLNLQ